MHEDLQQRIKRFTRMTKKNLKEPKSKDKFIELNVQQTNHDIRKQINMHVKAKNMKNLNN